MCGWTPSKLSGNGYYRFLSPDNENEEHKDYMYVDVLRNPPWLYHNGLNWGNQLPFNNNNSSWTRRMIIHRRNVDEWITNVAFWMTEIDDNKVTTRHLNYTTTVTPLPTTATQFYIRDNITFNDVNIYIFFFWLMNTLTITTLTQGRKTIPTRTLKLEYPTRLEQNNPYVP